MLSYICGSRNKEHIWKICEFTVMPFVRLSDVIRHVFENINHMKCRYERKMAMPVPLDHSLVGVSIQIHVIQVCGSVNTDQVTGANS